MAYTRGGFLRQEVRCRTTPTGLVLDFAKREGSFRPWWRQIAVTVHGWNGEATLSGARRVTATSDAAAGTLSFTLPDQSRAATLTVAHR